MPSVSFTPHIPQAEVDYLKAKGHVLDPSWNWQELWKQDHARAFTVAKSTGFDVLGDIHALVERAKTDGWTSQQFKKELSPLLQAKGWWGRKEVVNPHTGQLQTVQLGSARRLDLIYDVNMRTAHAAGVWMRIERNQTSHPYLRYITILDRRTRQQHKQWNGTVLRWDHPWWETHFPPNGWRCRCSVQQLSERDLERYGHTLSPDPPERTRRVKHPVTGEDIDVPDGLDPPFAYNPGKAALDVHAAQALAGKVAGLPPALAQQAARASAELVTGTLARGYRTWIEDVIRQVPLAGKGEAIPIGFISSPVLNALKAASISDASPVISVSHAFGHATRSVKTQATTPTGKPKALPVDEILRLPELLRQATAVYLDKDSLIYEIPTAVPGRVGKVVMELSRETKDRVRGERVKSRSTRIITVGTTDATSLKGYKLLWKK